MAETLRMERQVNVAEFFKLVEEFKAMKNRLHTLDLARLEEQRKVAFESALKNNEKRARIAAPEEMSKLQQEARKIVDADHERSKEILGAKFDKIDASIQALAQFLQQSRPIRESEARLAAEEQRLRKEAEEMSVQRKVMAHEQEELDRDKKLLDAAEQALSQRKREVEALAANLDVVRRAKELDQQQAELEAKLKAYKAEEMQMDRQRQELTRDFKNLGEKRAEIDREVETMSAERSKLDAQKSSMADAVAKEIGATFEAFVRDMLKPPRPDAP